MSRAKYGLCLTIILFMAGIGFYTLNQIHKTVETSEENEEEEKESGVDKQMAMWFYARAYPDPYYLNDKYQQAWEQAKTIRNKQYNSRSAARLGSAQWKSIGPSANIGGRILSLAINSTNTSIIFAGSAGGGIWKTKDAGANWQSVATGFPLMGVPSIVINPSNTNIIYAGTGEIYRLDSTGTTPNPNNFGLNVWKARGTYGLGILKSTDGGVTWKKVMDKKMADMFGIQMLKLDPVNPDIVYACATDGLYRSNDAGATWTNILPKTYVSDVVINKSNTSQIVAAVGNFSNTYKGIYRSTNGGSSWVKIASALPASFQGFIRLDNLTSAGNENTIVASIGVSETSTTELYRSTDFGSTWTGLNSTGHTKWQYWCAHDVAINPSNTGNMVFGGVNLFAFTTSTAKNGNVTTSSSEIGANVVHDDIHDIKFDPSNSSIIYIACDGGIYKSTDGGTTFSQKNNGLNATQFYASVGVSVTDSKLIVGGLQDNGVIKTTDGGVTWTTMPGSYGDGSACLIDPKNDNNILASGDARNVYLSTNRGGAASNKLAYLGGANDSRTAFVTPMAMSKKKPSVVYVGSDNLHKSTDGGATWSYNTSYTATSPTNFIEAIHKTAIAMAVSPTDVTGNKLFVSTSPFAQYDNDDDRIYVTGQPNVLKTLNGATPFTSVKSNLPDRFVMDFAISEGNDDSVFVAVGGFGTPHIYVTGNGGTSWTAVGNGLPDAPFNAVLIDPANPKVLYAAGDMGVYVSPNRGETWLDYNNGFTDVVQVMDLQATAGNQLVVATHGKGAFIGPAYVSPLPVTIVSFTGTAQEDANKLQWQVAQEQNLSHYEVERSTDGNTFSKVAHMAAKNYYTPTAYEYNDAMNNPATYYYRLKSVDFDGSYEYSQVVALRRNATKETIEVLGNPFSSTLTLRISCIQNSKGQVRLYDAGGKLLRQNNITLITGQQVYTLKDLAALPAGIYTVEAVINNRQWRQRVVKR